MRRSRPAISACRAAVSAWLTRALGGARGQPVEAIVEPGVLRAQGLQLVQQGVVLPVRAYAP